MVYIHFFHILYNFYYKIVYLHLLYFLIKNLLATYYVSGFIAKGANKALHKVSYCGNNDDGFGVGVMLIILGLIMFYNSLKNLKIKRLIENVPTSRFLSLREIFNSLSRNALPLGVCLLARSASSSAKIFCKFGSLVFSSCSISSSL